MLSYILRQGSGIALSLLLMTLMPLSALAGTVWSGEGHEVLPVVWQLAEDAADDAELGGDLPGLLPMHLPPLLRATIDQVEYRPPCQTHCLVRRCSTRAPPKA